VLPTVTARFQLVPSSVDTSTLRLLSLAEEPSFSRCGVMTC